MPDYKGVTLLEEDRLGDFPAWKRLVLAYFFKSNKDVHDLLCPITEADLAAMPAEAAALARSACAANIAAYDANAGASILYFLGSELRSTYVRVESGLEIWAALAREYASWQATQAPALLQAFNSLCPKHGEGVGAFCNRTARLVAQLRDVGRPRHTGDVVDAVLQGLGTERPVWEPTILGLRGALTGNETFREVQARLVEQETRSSALLAPTALAPHVPPSAAAAAAPTSLEQRLDAMDAVLQRLVLGNARGAGRGAADGRPRPAKRCHRCGDPSHEVRACPHPPVGNRAPLPLSLSCANEWALDSAATQHMSNGGGAGVAAFQQYRPFAHPFAVAFGKRQSSADAIGIGDMRVGTGSASMLLKDVLFVPELRGNLFSVPFAVSNGTTAVFEPPEQPGGQHRVSLWHSGRSVCTATLRDGLYFLDEQHHACAAAVDPRAIARAWQWHRALGHLGFGTLAELCRSGLLDDSALTPEAFMQAREQSACEPCLVGKLRRTSHPLRVPRPVRILHRLHMDLCELRGVYFATVIDEATRFARVVLLVRKSDTAEAVRKLILWAETQTDQRVQRVRHDGGGEYVSASLRGFYAERGIQMECTAPYSPEANGLAERFNLTLLDLAKPMLADSGDAARGIPPLGLEHAGDAVLYAADLHNATPSSGAQVGRTPHEGFLQRVVPLGAFKRFGCRVFVHSPGKPHTHRHKLTPRAVPGRFLGFQQPMGSGLYRVLLDSGRETVSQTVVFDGVPGPPPLAAPPAAPPIVVAGPGGGDDDDSDDDDVDVVAPLGPAQVAHAAAPADALLQNAPVPAAEPALELAEPAVPPPAAAAPAAPVMPGRPVRQSRNPAPRYADYPSRGAQARVASHGRRVSWSDPLAVPLAAPSAARPEIGEPVRKRSKRGKRGKRGKHHVQGVEQAGMQGDTGPPPGISGCETPSPATPEATPAPPCASQPRSRNRERRAGGSARGATERLRQPVGRKGMQPLDAPLTPEGAGVPSPQLSSCSAPEPVLAPAAWAASAPASHGALERADMKRLTAASAPSAPEFREPDPTSVADALSRPDAAE